MSDNKIYLLEDTYKVEKLFEGIEDTTVKSCLQKVMGKVYVIDLVNPKSALTLMGVDGYFAGEPNKDLVLNKPIAGMKMIPQNEAWAKLIEECYPNALKFTRYAIRKDTVFDIKKLEKIVSNIPDGYEIKNIDSDIYDECLKNEFSKEFIYWFSSKEHFMKYGRGVVILKDGKIVSGASSFSSYKQGIEIEVDTIEEERRKGLAKIACAKLILSCLKEGLYPSWDAANLISLHLAESLGYEFSHEYNCYWVDEKHC